MALGPLLTGIATITALWLLPRAQSMVHVIFVIAVLAVGAVPAVRAVLRGEVVFVEPGTFGRRARIIGGFIFAFATALIVDVLNTPLVHNDALEYATVSRILFETRDLSVYPLMDPTVSASGFFAPWTHPPLYVALGYLSYAFQGEAADATLFRLIAPWCFLASVLCVAALGRQVSRNSSALAALICLSLPMLLLGAASAQIDALPVLGFTLAFIGVSAFDGGIWRQGAAIGLLLGLSMWTHSQAILFPVLLLPVLLLRHTPASLRQRALRALAVAGIALLVTLAIASPPYLRNLQVFGTPISDNPAVFAYQPLGWDDFFKLQRGLAHPQEILTYGVLKGFYAIEIFSVAFWLALLAVPSALAMLFAKLRNVAGTAEGEPAATYMTASMLVVAAYLAGTALSLYFGTDIMVRNERYMLVLVPCLALPGALLLDRSVNGRWMPPAWLKRLGFPVVAAALCLQLAALGAYRLREIPAVSGAAAASQATLAPEITAPMQYLRTRSPPDSVVLALRPADMFYSGRTMISYLDPRTVELYRQTDPERAFAALRGLGVDYVQVPDYTLPPFYNSQLMQLLAEPKYSELAYEQSGYQIYRIRKEPLAGAGPVGVPLRLREWRVVEEIMLGGSGGMGTLGLHDEPYAVGAAVQAWNASLLMRRVTVTSLQSQVAMLPESACSGPAGREFDVTIEAAGDGFLNVFVDVSSGDATLERKSLGGVPLTERRGRTVFRRRIAVPAEADRLQANVLFRPVATVSLLRADVQAICPQ